MAYILQLSASYADAIEWHGGRYLSSELLCRALVRDDDDTNPRIELSEPDAWALRQAWESEDCCLSCGSRDLNTLLDAFIGTFV